MFRFAWKNSHRKFGIALGPASRYGLVTLACRTCADKPPVVGGSRHSLTVHHGGRADLLNPPSPKTTGAVKSTLECFQ
jgi:hypothetical protein